MGQLDRFTVKVDTSTVPGYQNLIYTNCDEGETCYLGPAPGGLVWVIWNKTLELANIFTDTTKAWVQGKLNLSQHQLDLPVHRESVGQSFLRRRS